MTTPKTAATGPETAALPKALPPGSTIGIMGSGQLGRMTALAAARLGYRCHIYSPDSESPAERIATATTIAAYDDAAALDAFAGAVDVVTFEFENVPAASIERLAQNVPVRPGGRCLAITQHRVDEKDFVRAEGIATAPYRRVSSAAELAKALTEITPPAILKTTRLGYDGKGQVRIDAPEDAARAWAEMAGSEAILEGFVPFVREVSVVVARGLDGRMATFDAVENRHVHHILDLTLVPAAIADATAREAKRIAERLATALDLVGILAVEMFETADGKLLVNELAPRPHNSGHWTIDGCVTSQFEQHARAVCGLPLGSPERHSDAVMKNLIGDEARRWPELLADPTAKLHLYDKTEIRAGRKMGHVTWIRPIGTPVDAFGLPAFAAAGRDQDA